MKNLKLAFKDYESLVADGWSPIEAAREVATLLGLDRSEVYLSDGFPSYIFYKKYIMFFFKGAIYEKVV